MSKQLRTSTAAFLSTCACHGRPCHSVVNHLSVQAVQGRKGMSPRRGPQFPSDHAPAPATYARAASDEEEGEVDEGGDDEEPW